MDPARVDGLARVLESAARGRQIVVLTHEDRLASAVYRLDIEATVMEVTRRGSSVVELRIAKDPVTRHIDDATAMAKTDGLPPLVRLEAETQPADEWSALVLAALDGPEALRALLDTTTQRKGLAAHAADADRLAAHIDAAVGPPQTAIASLRAARRAANNYG